MQVANLVNYICGNNYLGVAPLRVAVPDDENIFLPNSSTDIPSRVAALCAAAGLAN